MPIGFSSQNEAGKQGMCADNGKKRKKTAPRSKKRNIGRTPTPCARSELKVNRTGGLAV